nr:ATP-dependent helicase [Acholeplasmatales bacterium]
ELDKDYYEYCSQYKYVLVDECQDTNQIQYELINKVSGIYQNIFMVGDEDQLIYSFRSSDIEILKDFQAKADEIIILNENYRCNKEILGAANKLIAFNQDRLEKDLISHIDANMKVNYKAFINQTDEAFEVSTRIKQLNLKGEPFDSMAVLYRNNNQMYAIEKILAKEKIPYTVYGGMAFFEYADIRSIIYIYRLLFNPRNEIAFEAVYNKPQNHIEWYEIKEVMENYHKQSDDIITYLSKQSDPRLKDLGERYQKLQELMHELKPSDFLMEILNYLKYNKYLKETQNQKPEYLRLMALKDMIQDLTLEEVKDLFNNLMLENKNTINPNGVSLMTIHKSKGLEFNTVFIIGCNDGILPGYSKDNKELEEDRRVFYVAITRAKQNLFLYSSEIHFANGRQYKYKPSQFIYESGLGNDDIEEFFGKYSYNK